MKRSANGQRHACEIQIAASRQHYEASRLQNRSNIKARRHGWQWSIGPSGDISQQMLAASHESGNSHGSTPPSTLDTMHTLQMNMSSLTPSKPVCGSRQADFNSCIPMPSPSLEFMPASGNVDGGFMWRLASAPSRMGSPHIAASARAPAALKCMDVVWWLRLLRSAYAMVGASRMQRGSGKQELAVLRVQFHSHRFDSTTASVCRTPPAHSLAEALAECSSAMMPVACG